MSGSKFWELKAESIQAPEETYNNRTDVSQADASFILRHASSDSVVLDIGSGSGMVVNKIHPFVRELVAVETFPGFSQFIDHAENVLVINASLENFRIRKSFDIITATGVMQFFLEEAARSIYKNLYDMLTPGGRLVTRNHVGLNETIKVERSDELQSDYLAEYRHVELEKQMLAECGFSVEVFDEVPPEFSVWTNSRHLYFVCVK